MESLPTCALTCLAQALANSTCSISDFNCICNDAQLNAQLQPCVLQSCTLKEALTTQKFSYTTCQYPTSNDTHAFPIVNIVGIVVAIVSVCLRVLGRFFNSTIGIDDYTIIFALATAIAIAGVGFPLGSNGLGKDIWMVPFNQIDTMLQLFFVEETLYVVCIVFIKNSLLLLYLRLFPTPLLRRAILLTLVFITCWGVASLFAQVFSCTPISYYWKSWDGEHEGKCVSHNALLLEHAIMNIVLDVVVIGLPMPTLIRLNLSREKRFGMCLMFAVGIIVTIISILRLVEAIGFNSTTNPTKDFVPVGVWSLLEVDIGIMCTCMPGIRALIKFIWKKTTARHSEYGSSSRGKQSSGGGASHDRYPSQSNEGQKPGQFIRLQEVDPEQQQQLLRSEAPNKYDDTDGTGGPLPPPKASCWTRQDRQDRVIRVETQMKLQTSDRYPDVSLKDDTQRKGERQRQYQQQQQQQSRTGYQANVQSYNVYPGRSGQSTRGVSGHFTWFRDGDS